MSTIGVRMHFAAGHRILGLTGAGEKCRNVHGHTFHVEWTFIQGRDEMALEYGELKFKLDKLIKENFDHGFVLHCYDDFQQYLKTNELKYYLLDTPPTTEAIAEEIGRLSMAAFPSARLVSVSLDEGPQNSAVWENPEFVRVFSTGGPVIPPATITPPWTPNIIGGKVP